MNIGIDAGGTLIKIAHMDRQSLLLKKFPVSELPKVATWINELGDARICLTGGKAAALQALIQQKAAEMVEFDATCSGVRYFLEKQGITDSRYVLTNVGTGTSIHLVDGDDHRRLGGTGVGGGTLIGLSQLLTGLTDFEDIIHAAAAGSTDRIDLKVSHIYEGVEPPIPGDLTASNFGRMLQGASNSSLSREELAASVIGLVGETVATVSVLAAGQSGVTTVIFIGSSFSGNNPLKEVVQRYTRFRGATPLFIENGEYAGAIGAWLNEG